MASDLEVSDPVIFDTQQTDIFLSAVKHHLGQMKSLQADFVQKRHMLVFEEPLVAEGVLYYKAPGCLRWELTKPFSSVLLYVNGKVSKIIKNGVENRQLDIGSQELMRRIIGMIVGWMQGDLDKSREYFNLEISRDQNYRVHLLPKAEALRKMIHSIDLIMDVENYHIRKVIIKEPRGDRIEIQYLKEQWNLELVDDLFKP
jgi:outer membrane lipoprotein-sorting protein